MVWNTTVSFINETHIPPPSSFVQGAKIPSYSDVMEEFRNNGIDFPYEPEDNTLQYNDLSGLGPARKYLTQRSCPETGNIYSSKTNKGIISPISFDSGIGQPNSPIHQPSHGRNMGACFKEWIAPQDEGEHWESSLLDSLVDSEIPANILQNFLTEEQFEVLNTIPSKALYFFINYYRKAGVKNKIVKDKMCRFCKNNGERESVYRSHRLRTEGRLTCPVLRHLVCERCGATGDDAHTIKYCKAITPEERRHYELLMYSRRLTKVTRPCARPLSGLLDNDFMTEPSLSLPQEGYNNRNEQLPPQWMELERKLSKMQQ